MKNLIGNLMTWAAGAILLSFGLIYLFRDSFMPYHAEAVSMEWIKMDPAVRYLVLALMRAASGGFISAALAMIILQMKFSNSRDPWIPWLILLIGSIMMLCISYATILIRIHTPGKSPLADAIIGELLLIAGFFLNRKYLSKT